MAGITGIALGIIGALVATAGLWLVTLGGSFYYLIAGVVLVGCGVLLVRRRVQALWLYAALLAGSVAWALWEVGLDWWPLAARLDVLAVIGVWLLMPWVRRALASGAPVGPRPVGMPPRRAPGAAGSRAAGPVTALAAVLAATVAVAVTAGLRQPHDIAGALPAAPAATAAAA
ncbi:MAG: membrane-bound PQQ-dependent dehydrogenase, glucose/quinate/shikimate family, partial [Comamonadaceae bacterium]